MVTAASGAADAEENDLEAARTGGVDELVESGAAATVLVEGVAADADALEVLARAAHLSEKGIELGESLELALVVAVEDRKYFGGELLVDAGDGGVARGLAGVLEGGRLKLHAPLGVCHAIVEARADCVAHGAGEGCECDGCEFLTRKR